MVQVPLVPWLLIERQLFLGLYWESGENHQSTVAEVGWESRPNTASDDMLKAEFSCSFDNLVFIVRVSQLNSHFLKANYVVILNFF